MSNKRKSINCDETNGFNGQKWISISRGSYHSMALTDCGLVYSWGYNKNEQLGLYYTVNRNVLNLVDMNGIIA